MLRINNRIYFPTLGEEVANTISHGVMSLLALRALPFAAVWAYLHYPQPVLACVSVSIFVISLFLMFLASTLYHSMNPASKHKAVFHILDHIFIYVAIAGSYTPIALSVIGASTQLLWLIAAGGLFYTLGAWFYARKGFRYHHLVWHLLINLGAACHFAGIVFYLY